MTIVLWQLWHDIMTLCHKRNLCPQTFLLPCPQSHSPHQSRHFSVLEANKKLKLYCFLWPSGIVTLCETVIRMYSSCWQIWSVRAECSEKRLNKENVDKEWEKNRVREWRMPNAAGKAQGRKKWRCIIKDPFPLQRKLISSRWPS